MSPDEVVVMEFPNGTDVSAPPPDFDVLFADEHERIYRGLLFITGSRSDAEELMQDAFLKLWERWDRIESIDDPVAYLFRIALNGSRMRARRAVRLSRKLLPLPGGRLTHSSMWRPARTSGCCFEGSRLASGQPSC